MNKQSKRKFFVYQAMVPQFSEFACITFVFVEEIYCINTIFCFNPDEVVDKQPVQEESWNYNNWNDSQQWNGPSQGEEVSKVETNIIW